MGLFSPDLRKGGEAGIVPVPGELPPLGSGRGLGSGRASKEFVGRLYDSHAQGSSIPRAMSLDKLVIRSGISLSSDKIGNLAMGASVLVLETEHQEDGSVRTKVGRDSSPRGFVVEPLGWITSVKRDLTGDLEQKLVERDEADTNAAFHRRAASESMASRIAQRRFIRHQESKPGLLLSSREQLGRPAMTPTTNNYESVVERLRQEAMAKPEAQRPKEKPAEVWLSAAELTARAEAHRSEAFGIEARVFDSVEERVGQLLLHSTQTEEEIAAQYGGKDARLSKVEFRKFARSMGQHDEPTFGISLLLQADKCADAEIDELFVVMVRRSSHRSAWHASVAGVLAAPCALLAYSWHRIL